RLFRPGGEPIAMYSMGGLAEYSVMPVGGIAKLPDELPLTESAVLGCAFLTACGAVRNAGQPQLGESVAVIGAGGVGLALVQVLAATGCDSISVIDISDEKLAGARRLGAHQVVQASSTDAVAAVREITDGRGVDLAFEVVGSPQTFRQATELVADGGRCCFVGLAAAGIDGAVEINRLVRRRVTLIGSFGGQPGRDLPTAVALAASGQINLADAVSVAFSLDQVDAAYAALERGEILGRAVIDMAGRRN
ncbi:MAG TPA: zinc-binding dehydrogenase, partial [Solirubrobacterales bacterium]